MRSVLLLCLAVGVSAYSFAAQRAASRSLRRAAAPRLCAEAEVPKLLDEYCLMSGAVASGYGRGSKKIGVPTANLPSSVSGAVEFLGGDGSKTGTLEALPRGVYVAWAGLRGGVHPAVVNVGLSPTFEDAQNPETIAEAHLLDPFETDFYGEPLTLLLLGFIRPEKKFPSFDELIAAIRNDIATSGAALKEPEYAACKELPRFCELLKEAAATAQEDGGDGDDEGGFSFMAPPEGYECEDDEECVIPDMDDDDDDE